MFYVWVGVCGILAWAQVWTLANFIWTTREAKRLFSLLGSGGILGGIFGGFFGTFVSGNHAASLLSLSALSAAGLAMTFAGFALLYTLFSRIIPFVPVWEIKEGRMRYTLRRIGLLIVPSAAELE